MTVTCSTLLVFALPHRAGRVVFSFLDAIVAAADAGAGRWRAVLVADADRQPAEGECALYLRASANLDALPLVRAAAFPAEFDVLRAHALALACDERWRHYPVLAIEDAACRELHAAVRLSAMLGFALSDRVLEVAQAGFRALQADLAPRLNAAAMFATMDGVAAPPLPTRPRSRSGAAPPAARPGFAPAGALVGEGRPSAALDRVLEDRPAQDVLVIADDAPAAVGANCGALAGRSVAGVSLGRPAAVPATAMTFLHALATDGELPPLAPPGFDLVVLHEVARLPTPPTLLAWVMDALAPAGMICGQEREAADVEQALGTLTRPGSEPGLVVTIEGGGWTAMRQGLWAS